MPNHRPLSFVAIVVIDAGIATEDNLALIQEKGYDQICIALKWEKITKLDTQKQEECGVYFSRTYIKSNEETLV